MGDTVDRYILTFSTREEADLGLAIINMVAELWWIQQGYTVIDHQLVPKNAATGEDDLMAARTITWDEVQYSPTQVYYFTSPTSDERFANWRSFLPAGIVLPEDTLYPAEWDVSEDDLLENQTFLGKISNYIKNIF